MQNIRVFIPIFEERHNYLIKLLTMQKLFLLHIIFLFSAPNFSQTEPFNYDLDWSTYFYCPEGSGITITASVLDKDENLYLVGGIDQTCDTFPDNDPLNDHHGLYDAYLAKFNPSGELEWFKYYGGSAWDIAKSVKIFDNYLYFGGSASSTDSNLNFINDYAGNGDGFVSKLTLDGEVLWSTYIGGEASDSVDVIDISNEGEIYVAGYSSSLHGLGTEGTFQPENTVPGNPRSGFIAKIDRDGNKVWGTYYGEHISGFLRAIAVGRSGVYVMGIDLSHQAGNYYGTPGSHKESTGTDTDNFIAKFSFEGERLWGTYFGGSANEMGIGPLTIKTFDDMIYFCGITSSPTGISTSGAQQEFINGAGSMFLTNMDSEGNVVWSTYAGTRDPSITGSLAGNFLNIDTYGNLYLSGITNLSGLATSDGYKNTITVGDHDAFVTKYSLQGQILWGTYFGGELNDGAGQALISDDSFVFTGFSHNDNMATQGSFLETLNPTGGGYSEIIVKFGPPQLGMLEQNAEQFVLWPNPTDQFVQINSSKEIKEVKIYDIVGKLMLSTSLKNETEASMDLSELSSGTYLLQVITADSSQIEKIIKM